MSEITELDRIVSKLLGIENNETVLDLEEIQNTLGGQICFKTGKGSRSAGFKSSSDAELVVDASKYPAAEVVKIGQVLIRILELHRMLLVCHKEVLRNKFYLSFITKVFNA